MHMSTESGFDLDDLMELLDQLDFHQQPSVAALDDLRRLGDREDHGCYVGPAPDGEIVIVLRGSGARISAGEDDGGVLIDGQPIDTEAEARAAVGGTAPQFRASTSRLINADKLDFTGTCRGTRYFAV